MSCRGRGTGSRPGHRLCSECGGPLELRRPAYGATTAPGDKFCGDGALDRARTIVEQLGGAPCLALREALRSAVPA